MKRTVVEIGGRPVAAYSFDTLVVGSGCAGYNAADWLHLLNRREFALLTEGVQMGTSRNTGSDKQTYYKLSLDSASGGGDSVREMAQTLFDGGGMNGDTALVEAACSVKSFLRLSLLGVPFPTNEYGAYVGYKTDHDPRRRGTSAGPLTSRYMTEALQAEVEKKKIPVFDRTQVFALLARDNRVYGLLAFDLENPRGVTVFFANHIILATGGPAAVYRDTVYPDSQTGSTGLAVEKGARCCNLNEWQYGLASVKFKWNVSGTYQQALPRYLSVDRNGNEREFLREYFSTPGQMLDTMFLKGYQWPFDVRKVGASSRIDLLVHHETVNRKNRVYMDFTREPWGLEDGFSQLGAEAREYLQNSGALIQTPINRLRAMNEKAIGLYARNGIDLYREPLEIAVCAQHCNGGLDVDLNWETSIRGLYAAGEAAGTFGIYRPGGSALNSTQTGSLRAAEHIALTTRENTPDPGERIALFAREISAALEPGRREAGDPCKALLAACGALMSENAAHLRSRESLAQTRAEIERHLSNYREYRHFTPEYYKGLHTIVTQLAVLSASEKAAERGSRGSALVLTPQEENTSHPLPALSFEPEREGQGELQLITQYEKGTFHTAERRVREIPDSDDWFETVWNAYDKKRRALR